MFHTALVVTAFLVLHLFDFWVKAKVLHTVPGIDTNGLKDLGALVIARFQILWVVVFYEIALLFLGFHLWHGFQSAFQTIGVNHPVYTPVIKSFGVLYTLLVTAGFMIIPIVIYFTK
jgi:succinate dehydrogenase / fumarate reductase cytochrome b subunit